MKPLVLGYDAVQRPVRLGPVERNTHMHVIGSAGSGKSKFLEWMIRGDLRNRQGFCLLDPHGTLYEDVLKYCAYKVVSSDIILLNPASPDVVIGFNPFQRSPGGDVSVQVDRRIKATMHAWNVEDTDQTPTLERTLRLIYTVLIEQNLSLPLAQHLVDFNAQEIRDHLVGNLESPLIQREWQELQRLRATDWRAEVLSAKNRLFRLLSSSALTRFVGLPRPGLNVQQVMDEGKILLVNLRPSDQLSRENARIFGALLVNEFFEAALRRQEDRAGRDPRPYYLYIDEFQEFVSLDISKMLDQVRKFGLFAILSHQRFGQLSEDLIDSLSNCHIKAVFGGLPVKWARYMAEEMFIGDLDPKKIKVAIYQTKCWPTYTRDKVYTKGTTHSTIVGSTESFASGLSSANATGSFFQPNDWFGSTLAGTSSIASSGSSQMSGRGSSSGEAHGGIESEADIPILLPVPFQELSSVQYYSPEEQLIDLTAALKNQFPRHCFIKIGRAQTQPMLVPLVKEVRTPQNYVRYVDSLFTKHNAIPAAEADRLIKDQEHALLQAASSSSSKDSGRSQHKPKTPRKPPEPNPFDEILEEDEQQES